MSELIIGLTGGIGSGKTTVANLFEAHGIDVVDTDIISREVVEPGSPALAQIAEKMGPEILQADGNLDRRKMRERVFSQPELKDWLNGLLHPLIREQMIKQSQAAASPYCLLAIPLLVENNLQEFVHRVLVIDCPVDVQIARASSRDDNSIEQIQQIINAQASREQRLEAADEVIDNSGAENSLPKQIETIHNKYLKLVSNNQKT